MGGPPRRHARTGRERGAVALEFALILPLFLMLVFGVVSTGLAYNDKLSIANAVREGARFGSTVDYSTGADAWGDAVQTRVQQVYFNAGSTLTNDEVCAALVDSSSPVPAVLATPTDQGTSCGTAPTPPTNMAAGTCAVEVWVSKPATIGLGMLPDIHLTLGAQSVSYYGRAAKPGCPGVS